MSERELLEEIMETVRDPELKVTAIRDRISNLLTDAGYAEDEESDGEEEREE